MDGGPAAPADGDGADHGAVHRLDGGDLGCARLLVLLRDTVAGLADGDVVHVVTTNRIAPIDLPVWCGMTGHTYLGPVGTGEPPTYAVRVTASPVATDPARPWRLAR